MKHSKIFTILLVSCLLCSCSSSNKPDLKDSQTISFITELALDYWDLNYKFPTSYQQSRDTTVWFFAQYTAIDSMLLRHDSEIKYWDQDTALLITYHDDTLAYVDLPCSCDWTDEIPFGPRAYDSLDNLILDNNIQVSKNGTLEQLTFDLTNKLFPIIENKMIRTGYSRLPSNENINPQYLLIEYLSGSDSIQLIKACAKYLCYFYDDYAYVLRSVLSEYCKNNNVSKLLMPVEIYIPQNNNPTDCKKSESGENN